MRRLFVLVLLIGMFATTGAQATHGPTACQGGAGETVTRQVACGPLLECTHTTGPCTWVIDFFIEAVGLVGMNVTANGAPIGSCGPELVTCVDSVVYFSPPGSVVSLVCATTGAGLMVTYGCTAGPDH